jgi:hypothetical protein
MLGDGRVSHGEEQTLGHSLGIIARLSC